MQVTQQLSLSMQVPERTTIHRNLYNEVEDLCSNNKAMLHERAHRIWKPQESDMLRMENVKNLG